MDIEIIKTLGTGMYATVFLCRSNKKYYIYRIERYDPEMTLMDKYYRQIDFDTKVAKKHPDMFMNLKSYGIINECDHKTGNEEIAKYFKNTTKCYYLMYSPVLRYTLPDIVRDLAKNKKLYLEMLYQIIEQINIMRKAGFNHGDIHWDNVMVDEKKKKFMLVDYGEINNKKYPQKGNETIEIFKNDLYSFIIHCCVFAKTRKDLKDLKIISLNLFVKRLKKKDIYKDLIKLLPDGIDSKSSEYVLEFLTDLFYPDIYAEISRNEVYEYGYHYKEIILYCIKHMCDKTYSSILRKIKKLQNTIYNS